MPPKQERKHQHWVARWTTLPDALRALIVFALLPNVLFLALGQFLSLDVYFINYDYLLLAAFTLVVGRTWGVVVLIPVLIGDLLVRAGPVFNLSVPELINSARELVMIDPVVVGTVAFLVLVSIAVVASFIRILLVDLERDVRVAGGLGVLGLLVMAGSAWAWQPHVNQDHELIVPDPLVTSSSQRFTEGVLKINTYRNNPPSKLGIPSATDTLFSVIEQKRELPDKVVLVVAEGMGLFTDDPEFPSIRAAQKRKKTEQARLLAQRLYSNEINQLVRNPLMTSSLRKQYRVDAGVIPKEGGTVEAEIRELCQSQVRSKYPNPKYLPRNNCLPDLLAEEGYQITGIHGNSSRMFSRHVWWKGLGIERRYFTHDIARITGRKRHCPPTVFESARCDEDALFVLKKKVLQQPGKQFVHWLTINAHQPVQHPDTTLTDVRCSDRAIFQEVPKLCREIQFQHALTSMLAEVAQDPPPGEVAFIVVGDHGVSFTMDNDKVYIRRGYVPYVVLWPRQG